MGKDSFGRPLRGSDAFGTKKRSRKEDNWLLVLACPDFLSEPGVQRGESKDCRGRLFGGALRYIPSSPIGVFEMSSVQTWILIVRQNLILK